MDILENLALYLKMGLKFRPYLSKIENELDYLDIYHIELDHSAILAYKDAKKLDNPRYRNDVNKFETLIDRVDEYNKDADAIKEVLEAKVLTDFLDDPLGYGKSRIESYKYIIAIIGKYKSCAAHISSFGRELERVIGDYDKICSEYKLHNEYEAIFSFENEKYIDHKRKNEIDQKCEKIMDKVGKFTAPYYDYDRHLDLDRLVNEHNEKFITDNLNNPLFNDINSRSLDKEQRTSVLTDEVSNLVIAGAGSGKTLTICGKVKYLLEVEHINPNDILLLSYSKKSADDLQEKISKISDKLTVGTFHKIGLDILKETQNKTFMVEDQYKAIIETYFRDEIKNRPYMLQKIIQYYALFLNDTKFDKKYKNEGELFEDLKKSDFDTLRYQLLSLTNDIDKKETIKKELVKSFEELAIANWYFINGIDYIYEAPYEVDVSTLDKRQYMPDFKLTDYPIYHEHYGIGKDGKASQYSKEESNSYVRNMQWKRILHNKFKTDCIETFSYEFQDGTIFEKLESELKNRNVQFKPLSDTEIMNALNSIYQNRSFKSFINLIRSFLSLYKASYRDDSTFDLLKNSEFRNNFQKQRASLFLDIVKDLYHFYMDYLKKEGKIDFDDMILESIKELDKTDNYRYKYIIVDEFQDISVSRMKFLQRLIKQGDSKLFAVGDDWQAIYRFSGCDLNIFLNFEEYFGATAITKITTTHRNSQELQDIVGPFIKSNPEQYSKNIRSQKSLKNPVRIMYYSDKKYYAFLDILKTISKVDPSAKVLVLGRNNKDFDDIALDNRIFIDRRSSTESKTVIGCPLFPKMQIIYSTVHASKGLEEDYVILINADDKRIGFPNKMEDDELLDLVLSHKSRYIYAEERRLWYVALTRTRSYAFIIANVDTPSIFLKEIKDQCVAMNEGDFHSYHQNELNCPKCKSGRLILRTNETDGTKFYGCSNYPYCNYSIDDMKAVARNKRCKKCGDFMVYRKGRWGSFFGCHNYPRCDYTEEYIPNKK